MTDIDSTLQERGDRYGSFEHHAKIAQDLQRVLHAEAGWAKLADDQRQALTVIMDKVARMLNGDPAYRDNWHDIVGYAKLVDDRMKRDNLAVFRANEATPAPLPLPEGWTDINDPRPPFAAGAPLELLGSGGHVFTVNYVPGMPFLGISAWRHCTP